MSSADRKTCNSCQRHLLVTSRQFNIARASKDGFDRICKMCLKCNTRIKYLKNAPKDSPIHNDNFIDYNLTRSNTEMVRKQLESFRKEEGNLQSKCFGTVLKEGKTYEVTFQLHLSTFTLRVITSDLQDKYLMIYSYQDETELINLVISDLRARNIRLHPKKKLDI